LFAACPLAWRYAFPWQRQAKRLLLRAAHGWPQRPALPVGRAGRREPGSCGCVPMCPTSGEGFHLPGLHPRLPWFYPCGLRGVGVRTPAAKEVPHFSVGADRRPGIRRGLEAQPQDLFHCARKATKTKGSDCTLCMYGYGRLIFY